MSKKDVLSNSQSATHKKVATMADIDEMLNDSIPTPVSATDPDFGLTLEQAKEFDRRLKVWIETEERRQAREAAKAAAAAKAKADAEAAAAAKAKADAEAAKAATDAAKAKLASEAARGYNGPGRAYRYPQYRTKTYGLTSDIWKAKRISNGNYDPVWVWYVDGVIDHVLSEDELEEFVF